MPGLKCLGEGRRDHETRVTVSVVFPQNEGRRAEPRHACLVSSTATSSCTQTKRCQRVLTSAVTDRQETLVCCRRSYSHACTGRESEKSPGTICYSNEYDTVESGRLENGALFDKTEQMDRVREERDRRQRESGFSARALFDVRGTRKEKGLHLPLFLSHASLQNRTCGSARAARFARAVLRRVVAATLALALRAILGQMARHLLFALLAVLGSTVEEEWHPLGVG